MSKNLKKLICTLMAGAMLATSTGLTALAEEPAAGADGAAAAVTEQTAPADDPAAKYENDTYYQNALKVVSALGIITGYDDGSIKPESTVTRAEMATIVLRMLAQTGNSAYKDVFTDVTSAHWAANTIQTAVEQGIIDGMGDGTFVPDGSVQYEQVMKMIVCAMNYATDAENAGGYPHGYVSIAGTTLKLLTGVEGTTGKDMPRGEVIKTVYNALLASYREITDFNNGVPIYKSEDTLGVAKFDMYEEEGILSTTPNISISSAAETVDGMVTIDGIDYKCDLNVDAYLASKVKFYYIEDKGDLNQIIAMFPSSKSTEKTIDAADIESIDASGGQIYVYKSKTSASTTSYKIKNATVVYNGDILKASEVDGDYDTFITPKVGSVKLVDYDSDNNYDIMFIDKYETMLVNSSSTEKLIGIINNKEKAETITYDLDDSNYKVTVTKGGTEATVKNLKKNDVASIKRNCAGTKIDIIVTGESITGSVAGIDKDTDTGDWTVKVNGQEYRVDVNASGADGEKLQNGMTGTFYLDQFDRIGYIVSESGLIGSESYAVVTKIYPNEEGDAVVRLFTQEGQEIEAKPSGSMKLWTTEMTEPVRVSDSSALIDTYALDKDSSYLQCGGKPVKLCKYTLNSAGELSKLYFAVDAAEVKDPEALVMNNENMNGVSTVGGTLKGYSINDGIVGFTVPDLAEDRGSGSNYTATASLSAGKYKNYDGGYQHDFMIGGFTANSPKAVQVVVEFTSSATSMWELSELGTASIQPGMIVSKINEAVDSEGEIIYEIIGYRDGAETSYMTTSTTSLFKFTGWNTDARWYQGELLYDATGKQAKTNLTDVLKKGDMITVATGDKGIRTMVIMASAADVAETAVKGTVAEGFIQSPNGTSASGVTRQTYFMGYVDSTDIDDSAGITLSSIGATGSGSVSYNTSQVFSLVTVTVDESGKIIKTDVDEDGGIEPVELSPMGYEEGTFDYLICSALKGNMSSGYVIRVVIAK